MFAFAVLSLALVSTSLVMPAVTKRQNSCTAYGAGVTDSLTYNFTLSVVDPNAAEGSAGVPVEMAVGPLTTSGEASTWWLQTSSASDVSDFPTFGMQGGALVPYPGSADSDLEAKDMPVNAGSVIEFTVVNAGNTVPGETPFCASSDAGDNASLVVNGGNATDFALCESSKSSYVLVFQPSDNNGGQYEFDTASSSLSEESVIAHTTSALAIETRLHTNHGLYRKLVYQPSIGPVTKLPYGQAASLAESLLERACAGKAHEVSGHGEVMRGTGASQMQRAGKTRRNTGNDPQGVGSPEQCLHMLHAF
ncbi:hypothetical protein EVJ58_g3084 [Rhodofomes roseus]|uniref:Uncharacterized protein n=1 Tax=Rhodofomes roseus TaxID=34475 RepID=A0A4Y9YMB3_9APHY|nr:hypothetical protein EVJ58_g3084 [Rhodofomes roseus]